jgi:hypothetical protein
MTVVLRRSSAFKTTTTTKAAAMMSSSTTTFSIHRPPLIVPQQQSSYSYLNLNSRSYSSTSHIKELWNRVADVAHQESEDELLPGSRAFVECDREALIDLFHKYAINCDVSGRYLDLPGLAQLLKAVGEHLDQPTLEKLFASADINGDGSIELEVSTTT